MVITVFVTEDFGTIKEKNRFKPRQIIQSAEVHALNSKETRRRFEDRRDWHFAFLPQPTTSTFLQKWWSKIEVNWYHLRAGLAELIGPDKKPQIVKVGEARVRIASVVERREILEELWQDWYKEKARCPDPEKVLRITMPETEFLVAEE